MPTESAAARFGGLGMRLKPLLSAEWNTECGPPALGSSSRCGDARVVEPRRLWKPWGQSAGGAPASRWRAESGRTVDLPGVRDHDGVDDVLLDDEGPGECARVGEHRSA